MQTSKAQIKLQICVVWSKAFAIFVAHTLILQVQQLSQTAQQQAHQPHLMPNLQSQAMTSVPLSMTMAANPNTPAPGNIRSQLSQLPQVHVIHQPMHSPSYLPQYTYNQQQQLMLQNMQGKHRRSTHYVYYACA